jgi:hypothetical protein
MRLPGRFGWRATVKISIWARTVPAILIVLGFLLLVAGYFAASNPLWLAGWVFVFLGVLLFVFVNVMRHVG